MAELVWLHGHAPPQNEAVSDPVNGSLGSESPAHRERLLATGKVAQ